MPWLPRVPGKASTPIVLTTMASATSPRRAGLAICGSGPRDVIPPDPRQWGRGTLEWPRNAVMAPILTGCRSRNVTRSAAGAVPLRVMSSPDPGAPPRPGRLEIRVLGPLEVTVDGAPLLVDTRKAVAILALLAVDGRPYARDELAAMLWPEFGRRRRARRAPPDAVRVADGARRPVAAGRPVGRGARRRRPVVGPRHAGGRPGFVGGGSHPCRRRGRARPVPRRVRAP